MVTAALSSAQAWEGRQGPQVLGREGSSMKVCLMTINNNMGNLSDQKAGDCQLFMIQVTPSHPQALGFDFLVTQFL